MTLLQNSEETVKAIVAGFQHPVKQACLKCHALMLKVAATVARPVRTIIEDLNGSWYFRDQSK